MHTSKMLCVLEMSDEILDGYHELLRVGCTSIDSGYMMANTAFFFTILYCRRKKGFLGNVNQTA